MFCFLCTRTSKIFHTDDIRPYRTGRGRGGAGGFAAALGGGVGGLAAPAANEPSLETHRICVRLKVWM